MHENAKLITRFYEAFQQRDAKRMGECYHDDVVFTDEVFVDLRGDEVRDMWRMLCARGKDLVVEFDSVVATEHGGSAHWEAHYTFSASGRKVHNRIDARFEFRDGLIVSHRDRFSFRSWAGQALGPIGQLLGWSGFLRKKVQTQARQNLVTFSRSQAGSLDQGSGGVD